MSANRCVVVVGAGGMGREAGAWVADAHDAGTLGPLIGFVDDDATRHGGRIDGLPVLGGTNWLKGRDDIAAVVAVGQPTIRQELMERLELWGVALTSLLHPSSLVGPGTSLGVGSILCPGTVLTRDIRLGRGVIVNYGAALGHDAQIGEFSFIAPGVHVAGNVTVGARCWIGVGSSIVQGVTMGADVVIGAGAVVVSDLPNGVTALGVPARPREGVT